MAEQLWAPWRFDYVASSDSSPKGDGSFLSELPKQENDRENLILLRGNHAFVILNRFPYTSGHLMVAPYRETADMADLSDEELLEIAQLTAKAVGWLKKAYSPDGFNIGVNLGKAGGAGVPTHLHWHVVPRWNGDTNFMTAVGGTRVIPQSLESCYDLLKPLAEEA
jgi:ATP adenylyltransferase